MAHYDQSDEVDEQVDDASAEKLLAYDELLARGDSSDSVATDRATLDEDGLERQRVCIEMLREAWPPIVAADVEEECTAVRTLGDFRLLRQIGHGGMGVVYEAEQISLSRRVALKILPFAATLDERHLARFKREASAAAGLHHPNIVPIIAFGSEEGVHYYAMQYVEGEPLNQILHALRAQERQDGQAVPIAVPTQLQANDSCEQVRCRHYFRAVADIGMQMAEALDYAHEHGVIHRDVKPANLLLDADGHLWIADFGLARSTSSGTLTISGDIVGTLRYMSPEQASGKPVAVFPRTDVYSLGATLYELLTLQPLFGRGEHSDLLRRIADEDPRPPRRLAADLPRDLETIVLKALEKRPEDRYETAQAVADDLQRFLRDEPIHAKPPTPRERIIKWSRRHAGTVWAAAAFVAVLFVVLTASSVMLARAARNAKTAEERATALAATARREKSEALKNLYRANVQIAHSEWEDGRVDIAVRHLEAVRPKPDEADFRCWEWYYVTCLCRGHESVDGYVVPSVPSCPLQLICRRSGDTYTFVDRESGDVRLILATREDLAYFELDPQGKRIALAADPESSLRVYDLATRSKLWGRRVTPAISGLNWSPSGDRIATVFRERQVKVWDANSGSLAVEMDGHADKYCSVIKWSPDGRWIAARSNIWDAASGERATRRAPELDVFRKVQKQNVDWGPSGERLATTEGEQLSVWELESAERLLSFQAHRGDVVCTAWAPDGESIATAGVDGRVKIWDAASGELQRELRGHSDAIASIHWTDGGKRLVSSGGWWSSGRISKIWDPDSEQGCLALPGRSVLTWTPSGQLVACGRKGNGWTYDFVDPSTGKVTASIADEEAAGDVICVSVDQAGRRLAASDTIGNLRYWDISTGKLLGTIKANEVVTRCVAWSPDGTMLATSGDDGFKVWDVDNREMMAHLIIDDGPLPVDGDSVIWSPDSRTLVGVKRRTIRAWNSDDWQVVAEIHTGDGGDNVVNGLSWNCAGDRFVSCTGLFVNVREATTGRNLMEIKAHNADVMSVAWSPDGTRIATGSRDHLIKLWDAETGEDMLTLRGHAHPVTQLAWSPNARILASSDGETTIVWDATAGYARAGD